jgi:hypothetical protein
VPLRVYLIRSTAYQKQPLGEQTFDHTGGTSSTPVQVISQPGLALTNGKGDYLKTVTLFGYEPHSPQKTCGLSWTFSVTNGDKDLFFLKASSSQSPAEYARACERAPISPNNN